MLLLRLILLLLPSISTAWILSPWSLSPLPALCRRFRTPSLLLPHTLSSLQQQQQQQHNHQHGSERCIMAAAAAAASENNHDVVDGDDYQPQYGQSFIGGDPCGSIYNKDPHNAKVEKPGMPDSMKARIQFLVDQKKKQEDTTKATAAAAAKLEDAE